MSIFSFIKSWLPSKASASAETNAFDVEQFIYVKIPGDIGPMDRGNLFEDRIEPVLSERNVGSVSGGGSLLGDVRADGSRPISFCGIDIDTTSRDEALRVLRELLPTINVPMGTELHYTRNGQKLQDELASDGWLLERRRAFDHPGFGV